LAPCCVRKAFTRPTSRPGASNVSPLASRRTGAQARTEKRFHCRLGAPRA
jgi:hypothetical protein